MYKTHPTIVYGFHALDKTVALKILNQEKQFKPSMNDFDWLGNGIYFWENSESRANDYSKELLKRKKILDPFVLGATIELGNCLDLLNPMHIELLKYSYDVAKKACDLLEVPLPENTPWSKNDMDIKKRNLDCLVINTILKEEPFDSVRGAFLEGEEVYPTAGFKNKNHIQISVINTNCIKGIFLPRKKR